MAEESADWAGLCLFFAQGSTVTKTLALSALCGLGGGGGGSNCEGMGEKLNQFAEPGNMERVDHHNNRSCALFSPPCRISLRESRPKKADVNRIADPFKQGRQQVSTLVWKNRKWEIVNEEFDTCRCLPKDQERIISKRETLIELLGHCIKKWGVSGRRGVGVGSKSDSALAINRGSKR